MSELGRYNDELGLLWAMTAGARGFHVIEWRHETEGLQRHWVEVGNKRRFVELVDWLGRGMSLEIAVSAVPRPERSHGTAGLSSVLWARTEGKEQLRFLERFRPRPTLVLEEGDTTRRTAFWALSSPLNYEWTVLGNKRIAHALRAPKKHAEPEFMFNPPGSCLRDGRARPVLIRVAERTDALYHANDVVGRTRPGGALKDPPDPDAWRTPPGNVHGRAA